MKHALRLCAITLLFSATALQCSQSRELKVSILGTGSLEAYVTLIQDGKASTEFVSVITGLPHHKTFNYSPTGGEITLKIYFSQGQGGHRHKGELGYSKQLKLSDIIGAQISIRENPQSYSFIVNLHWADAPSKTKIRTYKIAEDKVDWTVVITDNKDTEITKKTFKKNTGDLYLQLNSYEITQTDDPNIVYNANKIKVFKGKDISGKPLFEPKIITIEDMKKLPKGSELEISAVGANFVEKGTEKKSKVDDKKIRAYKVGENDRKVDWTVQITDNSGNDEISHSTFKKNTDGVATKSLKLRLNPQEITDGSESQKRYNANKVKVFKGKKVTDKPLFEPAIITATAYAQAPNSELQITATEAKLVPPGGEPK